MVSKSILTSWDAQKQAYSLVNLFDSSLFPNDKMQTAISSGRVTNGQLQAVLLVVNVYLGLNRANTPQTVVSAQP